ncbi:MAG: hypothetical protein JWM21_1240 [Acidobacteria bacterium]|nr:hypothetical protein [Acidobacteriota bacterium]
MAMIRIMVVADADGVKDSDVASLSTKSTLKKQED